MVGARAKQWVTDPKTAVPSSLPVLALYDKAKEVERDGPGKVALKPFIEAKETIQGHTQDNVDIPSDELAARRALLLAGAKLGTNRTGPKTSRQTHVESKTEADIATPVKPGDRGTYGELKAQKKVNGETEALDMDHRPSFAAQKAAAEEAKGRALTPAEIRELRDNTPAVATPRREHQTRSDTYGGRNTPEKIQRDKLDLEKAADKDDSFMETR